MQSNKIDRRNVSLGLSALLALAASACATRMQQAANVTPQPVLQPTIHLMPFVDAHCHMFNAADLPVSGFVNNVMMREASNRSGVALAGRILIGAFSLPALLDFVDELAKSLSVTAAAEIEKREPELNNEQRRLRNEARLTRLLLGLRGVDLPGGMRTPQKRALVQNAVKFLSKESNFKLVVSLLLEKETKELVLGEFGRNLYGYFTKPKTNEKELEALRKDAARIAHDVFDPDNASNAIAYYLAVLDKFMHSRDALVRELDSTYASLKSPIVTSYFAPAGGGDRLRIYTPAMLDYDFWVQGLNIAKISCSPDYSTSGGLLTCDGESTTYSIGTATTPIPEQVEVWKKISSDYASRPSDIRVVHALVPFDPLRYIWDMEGKLLDQAQHHLSPRPGSALYHVVKAIKEGGAVGVKVYPPMGFIPTDNVRLASPRSSRSPLARKYARHVDYPWGPHAGHVFKTLGIEDRQQQGTLLDTALDALYDYCNSNNVPIMTHTSRTQGTFYDTDFVRHSLAASLGANPAAWQPVLERYRTLRLNLAHMGGTWCMGAGKRERLRICEPLDSHGYPAWPYEVFKLIAMDAASPNGPRYPNLYADVGDWSELAEAQGTPIDDDIERAQRHADRAVKMLKFILANRAFAPAVLRTRLMYGSDWIVMLQSKYSARYLEAMAVKLEDLFSGSTPLMEREAFLGGNAIDFFGLSRRAHEGILAEVQRTNGNPAETPYERLKTFYVANGNSEKWSKLSSALGHT